MKTGKVVKIITSIRETPAIQPVPTQPSKRWGDLRREVEKIPDRVKVKVK